ncbi:MAG: NAD(P)/FAD-dependent oxidoreductase [Leucobacter sp.]
MSGIVIIGGGLAGGRTARTVRELGYTNDVTIVSGEPHYPYERPPLSKEVLQGKKEPESVFLKPEDWYAEQRIDVRSGASVTAINVETREVTIGGIDRLAYDKLVIATGARARELPIDGRALAGVSTLRTLDSAVELRDSLASGDKRLVVIGSGWIGMEVAASARSLGNEVTVVARGDVPLSNVLGAQLGRAFQGVHEAHGVSFLMNAHVEAIIGDTQVSGVRVNGETMPADLVVVGVGAIPNTELAEAAGIAIGSDESDGILTDAAFHTSAPDVFAVGDVASVMHPVVERRLRSEHWANALNQGKAVARVLVGDEVSYDEIPYFYTDQFEIGMELSGYPHLMKDARIVVRGDLLKHEYIAFWVLEGSVVAGMNVNVWDVNETVQKLIRSTGKIDEAKLVDLNVALEDLVHA